MSTVSSRRSTDDQAQGKKRDRYLILLGVAVVCSSLVGVTLPLLVVVFGRGDAISTNLAAVMGSVAAIITAASVAVVALLSGGGRGTVVVDRRAGEAAVSPTGPGGAEKE